MVNGIGWTTRNILLFFGLYKYIGKSEI